MRALLAKTKKQHINTETHSNLKQAERINIENKILMKHTLTEECELSTFPLDRTGLIDFELILQEIEDGIGVVSIDEFSTESTMIIIE